MSVMEHALYTMYIHVCITMCTVGINDRYVKNVNICYLRLLTMGYGNMLDSVSQCVA